MDEPVLNYSAGLACDIKRNPKMNYKPCQQASLEHRKKLANVCFIPLKNVPRSPHYKHFTSNLTFTFFTNLRPE